MGKTSIFYKVIFLFYFISPCASSEITKDNSVLQLSKKESNNLVINMHVVIDADLMTTYNQISTQNFKDVIIEQLDFAENEIRKYNTDVSFFIRKVTPKKMSNNMKLNIDSYLQGQIDVVLIFQSSSNTFGSALLKYKTLLFGVDLKNFNHNYKWVILHEISHLFGAIDLIKKNNVMNEESHLKYNGFITELKSSSFNSSLEFDSNTISLIELATIEINKMKKKKFFWPHFSKRTAEEMINCFIELLPYARFPEDVYSNIGYYYFSQKQYNKALENYKLALNSSLQKNEYAKILPTDYYVKHRQGTLSVDEILYSISECYIRLSNLDQAISYLELISDSSSEIGTKLFKLGKAYYFKKDWDKSIHYFEKNTKIVPKNSENWQYLGLALLRKIDEDTWHGTNIEKAKKSLIKSTELNDSPLSHFALAVIFDHQGEKKLSINHLDRAVLLGERNKISFYKKNKMFNISYFNK